MTHSLRWLIQKDLLSEFRSRQTWPETIHLGVLVAVVFGLQFELPHVYQMRIAAALFWFATLFAILPTLERSFAAEREDRCLDALLLAPLRPSTIYLAKMCVNAFVLAVLSCVLVPLWVTLLDVPFLDAPAAILVVTFLGNLGIAALGTLLSALVGGASLRGGGLAFLILPLAVPVLVAASEATRLTIQNDLGPEWCRWVGFLGTFAFVFILSGCTLLEFAVRE